MKQDKEPKKFDIFLVNLQEQNGSVQKGFRPCMVVQNNYGNYYSPTIIVAGMTSVLKKLGLPTHVAICKDYGLNEDQAEKVVPMVGTIGIVLICCNTISFFHLPPPAKNIAFPFAMAVFAIGYVIVTSIRFVGFKGFGRSFVDPMPFMLPFKILDFFIKPISLALRLFGNVFGAFILMEFLGIVIPIVVPGVFSLWFDLMDGILQAVVFSYLTTSYIGEVVAETP